MFRKKNKTESGDADSFFNTLPDETLLYLFSFLGPKARGLMQRPFVAVLTALVKIKHLISKMKVQKC